jgi:LCP family protein required for cell wall assembly
MIEDELRTSFARHEELAPDADRLGPAIDAGARRLRRRRAVLASTVAVSTALVMAAAPIVVPRVMGGQGRVEPGVRSATGTGHPSPTGPLNFLVLGLDRRPGQPASEPARADTIVIVHISAAHDRGYLISVPRDLMVDVPGHGLDKINAAYAYGGGRLARKTVENLTGLTFDGTAEVRFEGLSRITDALGGVPMCLDQRVASVHTGRVFERGCKRLSGDQALDLLRQRYGLPGGALDRDRNARQFISALLDEAGRTDLLSSPVRLGKVLSATGDAMTVDLPRIDVVDLALELRGLAGAHLEGDEVPIIDGGRPGISSLGAAPGATALYEALRSDDLGRWFADKRRTTIGK